MCDRAGRFDVGGHRDAFGRYAAFIGAANMPARLAQPDRDVSEPVPQMVILHGIWWCSCRMGASEERSGSGTRNAGVAGSSSALR